jgi:hypothetical protein
MICVILVILPIEIGVSGLLLAADFIHAQLP